MTSSRWIPTLVFASLLAACGSAKTNPGPPPPCPSCRSAGAGMDPATTSSGSGGATSTGSGGQGGGDTATVTGTVVTVEDLAFITASPYTKTGFVTADGLGTKELKRPYDGFKFTIDEVAVGAPWFLVTPTLADTVFPTYSQQNVPASKVTLPVLDRSILETIGLDAGLQLSSLQAQIVIRVTRNGKTLKGISAESDGAGLVLYDLGASTYSIQGKATSDRGIIVLINQSTSAVKLIDATQTPSVTYNPEVRATPGTASLIAIDLPQ